MPIKNFSQAWEYFFYNYVAKKRMENETKYFKNSVTPFLRIYSEKFRFNSPNV